MEAFFRHLAPMHRSNNSGGRHEKESRYADRHREMV